MTRRGPRAQRSPMDRLIEEVRTSNMLLAASLRGHMGQAEIIRILSKTDLSAEEIGNVLGTTAAVVSVTLARLRKRQRLPNDIKEQVSTNAQAEAVPEVSEDDLRPEGGGGE